MKILRPPTVLVALGAAAALGVATQAAAQPYYAYGAERAYHDRLGSADPCRREAGNRALTWGVIGLLAGATAGGAAAAAGVVAEGAALGGVVGAAVGAKAGAASAACGTARDPYAYWNHPAYRSHHGLAPSPYYANPSAAEHGGYHDYGGYDGYAYAPQYEPPSGYSYDSRSYSRRAGPCCEPYGYEGGYRYEGRYGYGGYDGYERYERHHDRRDYEAPYPPRREPRY